VGILYSSCQERKNEKYFTQIEWFIFLEDDGKSARRAIGVCYNEFIRNKKYLPVSKNIMKQIPLKSKCEFSNVHVTEGTPTARGERRYLCVICQHLRSLGTVFRSRTEERKATSDLEYLQIGFLFLRRDESAFDLL
jgi:hypothetical protein